MATKTIDIPIGPTGLTGLTLRLTAFDADTQLNSGGDDTLTERTNKLGWYTASVTEAGAKGLMAVVVLSGSTVLWTGTVYVASDSADTYVARPGVQQVDVSGQPLTDVQQIEGADATDQILTALTGGSDTLTVDASGHVTLADGVLHGGPTAGLRVYTVRVDGAAGEATIKIAAGTDQNAIAIQGNGVGSGIKITGGATGNGVIVSGGGTSGNAIDLNTTSGDGINADGVSDDVITPNVKSNVQQWLGTAVTVSGTSSLPEVDAKSISDSASAADYAQLIFESSILVGSVNDATPTTSAFTITLDDITPVNGTLDGGLLVFTSGSNQGLPPKGISSNDGSTGNDTDVHFDGASGQIDESWDSAPANGDTFVILGRFRVTA